jgi:hypothetical protein
METREISRKEWKTFFDQFSQEHEGWPSTLEVFGLDIGAQQEGDELPFEGVSVSSGQDEPDTITVTIGSASADHVSHTIEGPTHVWLEQTEGGANAALEIEAEDQSKTLLRFRSPA